MKKVLLLLFSTFAIGNAYAQIKEVILLDKNYKTVSSQEDAYFIKSFLWDDTTKNAGRVKLYWINKTLIWERHYANYANEIYRDSCIEYRPDGKVKERMTYDSNNKLTQKETFYVNGNLFCNTTYDAYNFKQFQEYDFKTGKIDKYGYTQLYADTLYEKRYSASDSVINEIKYYQVLSDGSQKLFKKQYFTAAGNPFYDEYYHVSKSGIEEVDSLYSYYPTGKLKRKEYFIQAYQKQNVCFTEDGEKTEFSPMFQQAHFPGGEDNMLSWLAKNIAYPREAREAGISGTIYVEFVVCTDGELCEFQIVRGIHPSTDQEVLNALKKMPKWIPARLDGEIEKQYFTLPVGFESVE